MLISFFIPKFRFPNSTRDEEQLGRNLVDSENNDENTASSGNLQSAARIVHDSIKTVPSKMRVPPRAPTYLVQPPPPPRSPPVPKVSNVNAIPQQSGKDSIFPHRNPGAETEEQIPSSTSNGDEIKIGSENKEIPRQHTMHVISSPLQSNVVTSSDDEKTPPPLPKRPPGGHGTNKRRSLCRELADLQSNASSMISGKFFIKSGLSPSNGLTDPSLVTTLIIS